MKGLIGEGGNGPHLKFGELSQLLGLVEDQLGALGG